MTQFFNQNQGSVLPQYETGAYPASSRVGAGYNKRIDTADL